MSGAGGRRDAVALRGALIACAVALSVFGSGLPAAADERPAGLTPHLYNPPPSLSGVRRQGALSYETRLKGEIQRLERGQDAGELRRLNRVRREAARIDRALGATGRPVLRRRPVIGVVRTRR